MTVEDIAKACHMELKAYNEATFNDFSYKPWWGMEDEDKEIAIIGVEFKLVHPESMYPPDHHTFLFEMVYPGMFLDTENQSVQAKAVITDGGIVTIGITGARDD